MLEHLAKEDYRDSTQPVALAGNSVSHAEAGRVLTEAGPALHAELFGPEASTEGPVQPAELLILEADGSRYRTNEEDRKPQATAERPSKAAVEPGTPRKEEKPPSPQSEDDPLAEEERKRGWRENKVGLVVRALPGKTKLDGEYQPPEELVKTYVATTASLQEFEQDLLTEAQRRGAKYAKEVVSVSDNGHGLPTMWPRLFNALGLTLNMITDFFHCAERLAACAAVIKGEGDACKRQRQSLYRRLRGWLWEGEVEKVIALLRVEARRLAPQPAHLKDLAGQPAAQTLWGHLFYFEKYKETMDYPTYRAKGWPMGSGSVESACGQFGGRVKHNRMRWSRRGADALHVVKAAILSGDDRWAKRWPPPIPVLELPAAA